MNETSSQTSRSKIGAERLPRRAGAPYRLPSTTRGTSVALGAADPNVARLRWALDGESMEIDIAGDRGLLIVPVREYGDKLTSLLLDALDRAAPGGRRHIQISRGNVLIDLSVPDDWPAAGRLPSIVLGAGGGVAQRPRRPTVKTAPPAPPLGAGERAELRRFPDRRRRLAARRRQLEDAIVGVDERSRRRVRSSFRASTFGVLGLTGSVLGAVTGAGPVVLASSAVFAASSALLLATQLKGRGSSSERRELEERLLEVGALEANLEMRARELSRKVGAHDVWDAAALVEGEGGRQGRRASASASDDPAVDDALAKLAHVFGVDVDDVPSADGNGRIGSAWPPEVAVRAKDRSGGGEGLRDAARLVARVERDLPPAWPLLLWNPWSDRQPDERARLLLALREAVRPRQVMAIVDATGGAPNG